MTVVRFRVRLEDESVADEVAQVLEDRLGRLDGVDEVQAALSQPQAIGEIVMVVAGAVAVARGGRDIVTCVRQTVEELRALVESWRDLKRILFVEVDGRQIDVRELGDRDVERLAEG